MKKSVDSLIKKALQVRYDSIVCPPKEEIWNKIVKRLRKKRRQDQLKRLRPVFAACAILVVISWTIIRYPSPVLAFASRIIQSIEVIAGTTFKIHTKVVSDDTLKDNDYSFGRNIEDPRIGEAQKKLHFMVLIPEYIPDGFKLDNVDVLNKDIQKEVITFLYIKTKSEGKSNCFEIMQENRPDSEDSTLNIQVNDDTKIEHIQFNGIRYTLVNYTENQNKLLWNSGGIGYKIDGNISKKEIIRVAKSMK